MRQSIGALSCCRVKYARRPSVPLHCRGLCRSGHICRSRLSATYLSSCRRWCLLIAMTSTMTRYVGVAQPANLSPTITLPNTRERKEASALLQRLRSFEWPDPVGPGLAGRFACGRRKRTARPVRPGLASQKERSQSYDMCGSGVTKGDRRGRGDCPG